MAKNSGFEKCPYCGAWRTKKDIANHIGACSLYGRQKPADMEKPGPQQPG